MNYYPDHEGVRKRPFMTKKLILQLMRISFVMLVMLFTTLDVLLATPGNSQGVKDVEITLSLEKENLKGALQKVEKLTSFRFVFRDEEIKEVFDLNLPEAKRTVAEVLELLLRDTPLTYRELNSKVLIVKKEETSSNKQSTDFYLATITGKVSDSNGTPMPGVNVIVKGTTKGTSTDSEGKYSIDANENDLLIFSFIGYKMIEIQVANRSVIDITMEEDATTLGEVTINAGYYVTTDKTKTGSIAKVTSKEIEKQPVTSPLMALQGRVAGLDITPTSGVPGAAVKIQIRGQNSLRFDGGYPLYVIDGVQVDSRPIMSGNSSLLTGNGFDPLSTINPANIASIEILKDADATAIYGSRGANGVILITTKRGEKSEKTNLDVSFYTGAGKIGHQMDLLNTDQYLEMRHEAFKNANRVPGAFDYDLNGTWDSTRNVNWQKELMGETSLINDAQISVSSGNKNTSFRVGGGFHKESTVFPGDFGYQRQAATFSLNHTSSDQKFRLTTSINYSAEKNKLFEDFQYIPFAWGLPPMAPELYDSEGNLNWENSTWTNPLSSLKKTDETKTKNLVANANLSYKIVGGLTGRLNLGLTDLNGDELIKVPIASYNPALVTSSATGENFVGRNERSSWIVEPQLLYNKTFGGHELEMLVGSTFQSSTYEAELVHGTGYSSDVLLGNLKAATSTFVVTNDLSEYKYASIFGRIGYSWKGKYLLNLTGRRDGSSRFGPSNRFGNFGAIGAAWIFSEEAFIKNNISFLSFGKLRASYGSTGNDQIGDYKFYDTYSLTQFPYQSSVSLSPTALFNNSYAWEVTKKLEAAIEFGFIDDRIIFKTAWYRNRSSNQLVDYQLPVTTGFSSVLKNLEATIENRGLEIEIDAAPVRNNNFKWNVSFNVSIPKNKLIEYPGIEESTYADTYVVGQPLSIMKLYNMTGINPQSGIYEFEDVNSDGTYDIADQQIILNTGRKYFGGLNNSFNYKNFELSFLFQFSKQSTLGPRGFFILPGLRGNQLVDVLDRWQNDGDVNKDYQKFFSRTAGVGTPRALSNRSDIAIEDASFIRLKTLSLSYTLSSIKNTDLKFFIQGQNLFTITKYSGWDPETGLSLPPLQIVTLGIQANL